MRKMITAFALSTLFAAAPALAGTHHGRSPKVARPVVAGDAKVEGGAEAAKPEEKTPPKKHTRKTPKKAEGGGEVKPVEGTPAPVK